jgi:FkbM family methyltransferase
MTDERRRKFLSTQLGAGAAFGLGLAAGGAAGTAAGASFLARTPIQITTAAARDPLEQMRVHSYAQQGEDLVLWNVLNHFLRFQPITYMDVGAHHPVVNNNTYLFYERGHRGVLVEPNPALWGVLQGVRPEDSLIKGGIGVDGKDSEADYYVINDDGGLNTFDKEMAESYPAKTGGQYSIKEVLRMPLLDINGVMHKHFNGAPHLLSVDVEGLDLAILQSIDWKRYRPAVICIETLEFGARRLRQPILKYLNGRGYDVRGGTFVNTIFVDRRYTS